MRRYVTPELILSVLLAVLIIGTIVVTKRMEVHP